MSLVKNLPEAFRRSSSENRILYLRIFWDSFTIKDRQIIELKPSKATSALIKEGHLKLKVKDADQEVLISKIWCPREELNLHFILRTDLFYPLNYRGTEQTLVRFEHLHKKTRSFYEKCQGFVSKNSTPMRSTTLNRRNKEPTWGSLFYTRIRISVGSSSLFRQKQTKRTILITTIPSSPQLLQVQSLREPLSL